MLFNAYLIYLATIISTYSFNTYNYIRKRISINKEKKKMVYRKNLSSDTKFFLKKAELLPCALYLTSSLYSLVPFYNLCIPEKMDKWYYAKKIDEIANDLIDEANDEEIIQRYLNGAAIQVMKDVGYDVPNTKIKEQKHATMKLGLYLSLRNKTDELFAKIGAEPKDLFDLEPISNKEYKKKQKKILKLNNKNKE